jgi:hypothetical protein
MTDRGQVNGRDQLAVEAPHIRLFGATEAQKPSRGRMYVFHQDRSRKRGGQVREFERRRLSPPRQKLQKRLRIGSASVLPSDDWKGAHLLTVV